MKKLFLLVLTCLLLVYGWYQLSLRPVDVGSTVRKTIKVASGMSVVEIANLLDQNDLIRSPKAFVLAVKLGGDQGSLQAGSFVLRPSQSTPEIIALLKDGKAEEMILTIPEGFTVLDIEQLLVEKGLIENGDVRDCLDRCDFVSFEFLPSSSGLAERGGILEGYLYPDTYYIEVDDFVTKFFLERLLTTFRNKVLEPFQEDITASNRSLQEIITMASLIEEETRTAGERAVVSGILWKRYDAGSGLGVDATTRYILNKPTGPLTVADLNDLSPYNTRKFRGLPPGPIASPGIASIRAAINPQESPYWYYLHAPDGQIHYATTNEEHNVNKYRYLK